MEKPTVKPVLSLLLIVTFSAPAWGAPRCSCIANGVRIEEGQTTCIRPGSGSAFLARCVTVLNNTSWEKLQDGCPSAAAGSRSSPRIRGGSQTGFIEKLFKERPTA